MARTKSPQRGSQKKVAMRAKGQLEGGKWKGKGKGKGCGSTNTCVTSRRVRDTRPRHASVAESVSLIDDLQERSVQPRGLMVTLIVTTTAGYRGKAPEGRRAMVRV